MVTAQTYIKRKVAAIALICALSVFTVAIATEGENKDANGAWYVLAAAAAALEDGKTLTQCTWTAIRVYNQDRAFNFLGNGIATTLQLKDGKKTYELNTTFKGAAAYSMADAAIDTLENVLYDWHNGELKSPKVYAKDWARGFAIAFMGIQIVTRLEQAGISMGSVAPFVAAAKMAFAKKAQGESEKKAKKSKKTEDALITAVYV